MDLPQQDLPRQGGLASAVSCARPPGSLNKGLTYRHRPAIPPLRVSDACMAGRPCKGLPSLVHMYIRFFDLAKRDFAKCDLLIVMGTSLVVHPFAGLISESDPDGRFRKLFGLIWLAPRAGNSDPLHRAHCPPLGRTLPHPGLADPISPHCRSQGRAGRAPAPHQPGGCGAAHGCGRARLCPGDQPSRRPAPRRLRRRRLRDGGSVGLAEGAVISRG